MSLGTGALKVGRGPEHFRPRQGVSMATPWEGTIPVSSCQLAPSHWTKSVEKYPPDHPPPPILTKKSLKLLREGRAGSLIHSHTGKLICSDQLESSKIREKHMIIIIIDLLRSAWIHKDSQKNRSKLLILYDCAMVAQLLEQLVEHQVVMWEVVSLTLAGPTLRVLK